MPFPDVPRVKYARSPLEEVVCQLRFPALLKIDTEPPAKFQDSIRGMYPEYNEVFELKIEVPSGVPDQVAPDVLRQAIQASRTKNHQFSTEAQDWRVNLTRTFLALTTTKYQKRVFQTQCKAIKTILSRKRRRCRKSL
jgi:uncharacterized protein (TIGR04255 family)